MSKIGRKVKSAINTMKEEKLIPIITPVNNEEVLTGKIALVTGGSSGIGFAISEKLIGCGAKVIITGTNEDKLRSCTEKLGENARSFKLNICEVDAIESELSKAIELFPERRIDILINSAGVAGKQRFGSVTEEEYDKILDTNLKGTFFVSQAVACYMIENHIKGHILNVSSSSGLRPAWTPYHLTKWAINGLTKGMADMLIPHGIVVNAIAPGQTATPLLNKENGDSIYHPTCPAGRYTTPEEIANLAVFMVSSMGDMIVGDTFYITGGSGTISFHR